MLCIPLNAAVTSLMLTNDLGDRRVMVVYQGCRNAYQVPEDVVGTVVYLASADSDFMTGQTLLVDGGSAMI
jgi:NAD(P)-dependent dehydrogenase (short-subunit alcohol dehydrogenase family)